MYNHKTTKQNKTKSKNTQLYYSEYLIYNITKGYVCVNFPSRYSCVAREVLAEIIPSQAYDVHMLLCNTVGLLYNKQVQALGWSDENIKTLESLTWAHAVAAEEYYGLGICTENLEYSTHLSQDVKHHSSPDNYSCEVFERAIRTHKQQTHNAKGIEKTFAERENIRLFIRRYELKHGKLSSYFDGKKLHSVDLDKVNSAIYFHEPSLEAAKALLTDCHESANEHICHASANGVLVGKLRKKALQNHQKSDIKRHLQHLYPGEDIHVPSLTKYAKHVVRFNCNGTIVKFSIGDCCVVAGGPNPEEEWFMELTDIILIGAFHEKYFIFIDGMYFIPAFNHGRVVKHPWTETVQLVSHQYHRDSVQFTTQLMRKCILYPDPACKENPTFFLPIDFDGPPPKTVAVPVYPEESDHVKILGRGGQVWFAKIVSSDDQNHKANVRWFAESRRAGLYTLSSQEDIVPWKSRIC